MTGVNILPLLGYSAIAQAVNSDKVLLVFSCWNLDAHVLITTNNQGWPCHSFFILLFLGWHGPILVVWDKEYTNAQVGDAKGLFE